VIRTKKRDELKDWLQKSGVQCGVHYPLPIPLQPIYKQMFGYKSGDFPVSELASGMCLSLPIYQSLSEDQVEFICGEIREFFGKARI
jgi:dTDP-4-amino-4,6-dideoxygalactose transaminase